MVFKTPKMGPRKEKIVNAWGMETRKSSSKKKGKRLHKEKGRTVSEANNTFLKRGRSRSRRKKKISDAERKKKGGGDAERGQSRWDEKRKPKVFGGGVVPIQDPCFLGYFIRGEQNAQFEGGSLLEKKETKKGWFWR